MQTVEQIAAGLTAKAATFLVSVVLDAGQMWRTDEGQRVPSSLVSNGLVHRIPTTMGPFYTLTHSGLAVRDHIRSNPDV